MKINRSRHNEEPLDFATRVLAIMLIFVLVFPFSLLSANDDNVPQPPVPEPAASLPAPIEVPDSVSTLSPEQLEAFPDTMWIESPRHTRVLIQGDSIDYANDSLSVEFVGDVPVAPDTTASQPEEPAFVPPVVHEKEEIDPDYVVRDFNPDPNRALWMSALCPGLGQLYNRRYWKLPIVIGGFMGLAYATSWNNKMLDDYTQAYRDLMDNDPTTKSYMDFYPPNTKEEQLNRTWMEKTFKARKDYYRRYRDLCIICMVGVYLVAMVDAYVDASLAHFDISPDLSVQVYPTLIPDSRSSLPSVGVQWAFNF